MELPFCDLNGVLEMQSQQVEAVKSIEKYTVYFW